MKAISGISKTNKSPHNVILAIGVFDGVHLGHQRLIKLAVGRARKIGGQAFVLTFHPHPVHILYPQFYQPLIVSLEYRLKLLAELGVHKTIVVRFSKKFAKLSPEKFIKGYLIKKIQPREVFVGDDFRFGQNREGSIGYFSEAGKRHGFRVHGIHTIKNKTEKIGSTAIRRLIALGDLSAAQKLLGRRVSLLGKIVKGQGRGKKMGFPTANVSTNGEVLPPIGVYAARVIYRRKTYKAMVNIGHRPTFSSRSKTVHCEVHIFGFKGNLYGQKIIVEFFKKIRDEQIFPSPQDLQKQLQKDKKTALKILVRA